MNIAFRSKQSWKPTLADYTQDRNDVSNEMLRILNGNTHRDLTPAEIHRTDELQRELDRLDGEIKKKTEERSVTSRMPSGTPRPGGGSGEWRSVFPSRSEYREITTDPSDDGVTVPDEVASTFVDALVKQAAFLKALPAGNLVTFPGGTWTLPVLGTNSSDPDYVDEGGTIASEGSMPYTGLVFTPYKLADIRKATNEILADSNLPLREIIVSDMIRHFGFKLDAELFNGDGATGHIKGLTRSGNCTSTAAATAVIGYDDIADAVERIEATGGMPSVVWAAPNVAASLRKSKDDLGDYLGGKPADSPAKTAWGLPILTAHRLTAGTAVVADASRIFVGRHTDIYVKVTEEAYFETDEIGYRITARFAGVKVAEATSAQLIVPGS